MRERGEPNRWAVLGVVAVGVFMATLDSSIVNISLPAIARWFGVPLGGAIEWIVIAYLVVIAALLLSAGRVADMIGHKPLWIAGLVVFTLGSAACGAAPSLPLLVAFRGLQGIGGALIMAVSPAMLTRAFPAEQRGRALGLNAVFVALGVSAGPTLGGVLTDRLSWRWIFYVNLPLGIVGAFASWRVLHEKIARAKREPFDLLGAALLGLGLAATTGALSFAPDVGWRSPAILGVLAAGLAMLVALVFVERARRHPVLDLALFKDRVFSSATASLVLSFLALFATGFLLPFYLEQLRGMSTEKAGLCLTAFPAAIAVVSPISGSIGDRVGSRGPAVLGMAIAALGLVLVSRLDDRSSVGAILFALLVAGIGQAMFQAPNNSALMGAAPRDRRGVASGMLATARVVGQSLSVAVAGAIFASFGAARAGRVLGEARAHGALDPDATRTFLHGFQAALLTCAAVAAVAALTSAVRGRHVHAPGPSRRSLA